MTKVHIRRWLTPGQFVPTWHVLLIDWEAEGAPSTHVGPQEGYASWPQALKEGLAALRWTSVRWPMGSPQLATFHWKEELDL